MIGELKYEEVESIANALKKETFIINDLLKTRNIPELNDFTATVEGYSKYLETALEINKDADVALQELINQRNLNV